ncbi:ATP-binding protein [Streptomyces caniscabiei]|uniref:DUF7793 family protein n=1 Tax=Streptomyces caniscabiei TaxID=2746961 RepID=UPI0029B5E829|nr:ATP-binding protein [Streptomyces caniscabiei]MDX2776665.1 ATP-binding protein [Streptomyces caniscabiei]
MKLWPFTKKRPATTKGGYKYSVIMGGKVVQCTLYGHITRPILDKVLDENRRHTNKLAAKGLPRRLLTDIRGVTSVSAEARNDLQRIREYLVDRSAVYGANPFITLLTQYVVRMSTDGDTRVFKTRRQALDWLLERRRPKRRIAVARALAGGTAGIAAAMLASWVWNEEVTSPLILHSLAVGVAVMLMGVTAFLLTWGMSRRMRWAARGAGGLLLLVCVVAIAGGTFGIDTGSASWVFGDTNQIFFAPYVNIGLIGLLFLLTTTSLKHNWNHLFRFVTSATVLSSLFILTRQLLGIPQLQVVIVYGLLLAIVAALILITYRTPPRFPIAHAIMTRYWQGVIVFVVTLVATVFIWQQAQGVARSSELRRIADALSVEQEANMDVIRGYGALFQSSTFVDKEEFDSYFTGSGLQRQYPGLSTIGFLRNETGRDATPRYPVTYVSPLSKQGHYGLDLAAYPATLRLLDEARDSGEIVGSDNTQTPSIDAGNPEHLFIVEAVYTPGQPKPTTVEGRRNALYGFVVAQFSYREFFQNFFQQYPSSKDVALVATDHADDMVIHYQSDRAEEVEDRRVVLTERVTIAGHPLDLSILAGSPIAASALEGPNVILVAGVLVGLLISAIISLLVHRRYQALQLAEVITQDLEEERSKAVAAAQKDEAIFANIGDGLAVTDAEGRITLFNERFREIFGLEGDLKGRFFTDVAPMLDQQGHVIPQSRRIITSVLRQNKKKTIHLSDGLLYRRGDSSTFPASGTVTPVVSGGKVVGAIEVVRDVSIEADIDRAKTEFVSLASHQLRTPLTAAKWYTEFLLQGEVGKLRAGQVTYLREVHSAIVRTIKLVSSLLNVSRLEMGSIAVAPERTDVVLLARSVVQDCAVQISQRRQNIQQKYPETLIMNVDPKLVRMMIENLVTNAIKYTPEKGSITVSIKKQEDDVMIEVRDTGYGIPANQQDKIFTKLFRADNVQSKTTEGVGLGLYLVKSIVEYCGGDIWFESIENEGTTFHIRLPARGMRERTGKQII